MANVGRDNLHIIQISRKVILSDLVKKLGGSEPQYDCWFEGERYWSIVRTVIVTGEMNSFRKLEQAMGCVDVTKEAAEEKAAIALIEVLKRSYRFEIDDMNFRKRAEAEHENEQLVKQMNLYASVQDRQSKRIEKLSEHTNELLDDMVFIHETCYDICGTALASMPSNQKSGPLTDMMYSVHYLDEWTEQRIYEHIVKLQ